MVYITFDHQTVSLKEQEPEAVLKKKGKDVKLEYESEHSSVKLSQKGDVFGEENDFGEFVEEDGGVGDEDDFANAYSDNY